MEPQIPTGYENYPRPDDGERTVQNPVGGWENPPPPAPISRSYQGGGPSRPSPLQSSRRSMLGGVVGVGVVAVIGISLVNRPVSWGQTETTWEDSGDDPFDPGSDEEVDTDVLTFGGLGLDVPTGWTVLADEDSRALLSQGHNQLLLVSYEASSTDAAEEVDTAVARSETAFEGELSRPKTTSKSGYEQAVVTGAGTFEGQRARQRAEVLVDGNLSALFIQQVLAAKDGSVIAKDAARLAADLRDSWPW